jgi:hypothetical protein
MGEVGEAVGSDDEVGSHLHYGSGVVWEKETSYSFVFASIYLSCRCHCHRHRHGRRRRRHQNLL